MTTPNGSVLGQAQSLPETAAAFQDFIRQRARYALMQLIEQEVSSLRGALQQRMGHPLTLSDKTMSSINNPNISWE